MTKFRKILVANEIAIRIFRAARELGKRTVAIYAEQELSLHRFKSDEAYMVGRGRGPIEAYLSTEEIVALALRIGADAIHPGYGFLSESPEFTQACAAAGIAFIGPSPQTMRELGNKNSARHIAESIGVPVIPASPKLPIDPQRIKQPANVLGYPVMLKASWGVAAAACEWCDRTPRELHRSYPREQRRKAHSGMTRSTSKSYRSGPTC